MNDFWRPASFWRVEKGRQVCTLCPFQCTPEVGKAGRCRVRRCGNQGWETCAVASVVWHWHSVERKPFFHVRPGHSVLTLAMPGCTFRCDYCENAELSQVETPWEIGVPLIPTQPAVIVAEVADRNGLLAFSYTEPTLAAEVFLDIAQHARPAGVKILWNTNGFISDTALVQMAPHLFAVNIDLKTINPEAHLRLTGAPLVPVLEAMAGFADQGVWVEISTPIIPGFNDDEETIRAMAQQVASLGLQTPWHLLRFHPDHRRTNTPPTPPDLLKCAREWAMGMGLRYVYTHHDQNPADISTFCPGCKKIVVHRNHQGLVSLNLVNGVCPHCKAVLAGRW